MKKRIIHHTKSKRYNVKRYKQRHRIKRPKTGAWHTESFIHGPRLKQPEDFSKIYIFDKEFAEKRHLKIPKKAIDYIEDYAKKKELRLPKSWKSKIKVKAGSIKNGALKIQSLMTPIRK